MRRLVRCGLLLTIQPHGHTRTQITPGLSHGRLSLTSEQRTGLWQLLMEL